LNYTPLGPDLPGACAFLLQHLLKKRMHQGGQKKWPLGHYPMRVDVLLSPKN